jgi:hypothetical protein
MNRGAYMYYENNNHYLLIYGKLPQSILKNAMPLSYKADEGDYITTIFVNGRDYIGQSTYDNISKTIKQDNIIDIINNNYDEVKKVLPELTIDEYNENLEFSKKQLEIISKKQTDIIEEDSNMSYLISATSIIVILGCIYYRFIK